ncbi:hypothetical protein [Alloalcanivorax xenomutans]|uniref:hypothetical protein n=1 Tax=Alloalcanivorax xenomutans TaxID=1094342 RepID=UPI0024E20737|nr:hypothetical protein [Alloalcanivorax xenomutans]
MSPEIHTALNELLIVALPVHRYHQVLRYQSIEVLINVFRRASQGSPMALGGPYHLGFMRIKLLHDEVIRVNRFDGPGDLPVCSGLFSSRLRDHSF